MHSMKQYGQARFRARPLARVVQATPEAATYVVLDAGSSRLIMKTGRRVAASGGMTGSLVARVQQHETHFFELEDEILRLRSELAELKADKSGKVENEPMHAGELDEETLRWAESVDTAVEERDAVIEVQPVENASFHELAERGRHERTQMVRESFARLARRAASSSAD